MSSRAFGAGPRSQSLVYRATKAFEKRIPLARMNPVGEPLWLDVLKRYPPFQPRKVELTKVKLFDMYKRPPTASPNTDEDATSRSPPSKQHSSKRDEYATRVPLTAVERARFDIKFLQDDLLKDFIKQNPNVLKLPVREDWMWPPRAFVSLQALVMEQQKVGEKEAFERVLRMRDWEFYFNLYHQDFRMKPLEIPPRRFPDLAVPSSSSSSSPPSEEKEGEAAGQQSETVGKDDDESKKTLTREEKKRLKKEKHRALVAARAEHAVPMTLRRRHVFITRPDINPALRTTVKSLNPQGIPLSQLSSAQEVMLRELMEIEKTLKHGSEIERFVLNWVTVEREMWAQTFKGMKRVWTVVKQINEKERKMLQEAEEFEEQRRLAREAEASTSENVAAAAATLAAYASYPSSGRTWTRGVSKFQGSPLWRNAQNPRNPTGGGHPRTRQSEGGESAGTTDEARRPKTPNYYATSPTTVSSSTSSPDASDRSQTDVASSTSTPESNTQAADAGTPNATGEQQPTTTTSKNE